MKKYIALLRGVNVSGKNLIKMEELRKILAQNDFFNVTTYIQSGNIVFEHPKVATSNLSDKLKDLIKQYFNYDVVVIIKTFEEMEELLNYNPFGEFADEDEGKMYVVFMDAVPIAERIEMLAAINFENETYKVENNVIYLFCKNGYGKAKLNNNLLESKLKINATTRNWKTVNKLYEMLL